MSNYTLKYRTYDQLLAEIQTDFKRHYLEDFINPQEFIKIAKRCNHVIVLLSKSYLESEKCYADLYHMCVTDPTAYDRKLIPVMIECMFPPPVLMDRATVKYYRTDKKRENLQAIFRAIKPNHIVKATQR